MILPSYLRELGYNEFSVINQLNELAYEEKSDSIEQNYPWAGLRNIFEYLVCVEFAKSRLLKLPTGKKLGSRHSIDARYDAASLVFFAQATLDNLAVWLNDAFNLELKGINRSF